MNRESNWGAIGGELGHGENRVVHKILGHSFVRDLPLSAGGPLNGDINKVVLRRKFFVPGATVASIQSGRVWERFLNYKPDLTFLLIGGNDITTHSLQTNIARSIILLAKRVVELTGGEVKIITVERRPVPRRVSPISYNRQRTSINRFLKHRDPFTVRRLVFSEATDHDSHDGVHLRDRASHDLVNIVEWHIEQFAANNRW